MDRRHAASAAGFSAVFTFTQVRFAGRYYRAQREKGKTSGTGEAR
jgi:hypothetical protein